MRQRAFKRKMLACPVKPLRPQIIELLAEFKWTRPISDRNHVHLVFKCNTTKWTRSLRQLFTQCVHALLADFQHISLHHWFEDHSICVCISLGRRTTSYGHFRAHIYSVHLRLFSWICIWPRVYSSFWRTPRQEPLSSHFSESINNERTHSQSEPRFSSATIYAHTYSIYATRTQSFT